MNVKTSQRAFVGVTLTTVLGIALVLIVYATILGTITGLNVTVVEGGQVTGTIGYSLTNTTGTFTPTLSVSSTGTPWYAGMNTTGGQYTGNVTITWKLQKWTTTWGDVPSATKTTNIALTTAPQTIYASQYGGLSGNQDWHTYATTPATYRVIATVESP